MFLFVPNIVFVKLIIILSFTKFECLQLHTNNIMLGIIYKLIFIFCLFRIDTMNSQVPGSKYKLQGTRCMAKDTYYLHNDFNN